MSLLMRATMGLWWANSSWISSPVMGNLGRGFFEAGGCWIQGGEHGKWRWVIFMIWFGVGVRAEIGLPVEKRLLWWIGWSDLGFQRSDLGFQRHTPSPSDTIIITAFIYFSSTSSLLLRGRRCQKCVERGEIGLMFSPLFLLRGCCCRCRCRHRTAADLLPCLFSLLLLPSMVACCRCRRLLYVAAKLRFQPMIPMVVDLMFDRMQGHPSFVCMLPELFVEETLWKVQVDMRWLPPRLRRLYIECSRNRTLPMWCKLHQTTWK